MNIFENLYNFFIHLTTICEDLYQWLFTPVILGNWQFIPIFVGGGIVAAIMVAKFFL